MSAAVSVIAWALALTGLAGFALFALPVKVRVLAQSSPVYRLLVRIRPLGGVSPGLTVVDSSKPRTKPRRTDITSKRDARIGLKRAGSLASAGSKFVTSAVQKFRVERVSVDADLGLADPAATGQVYGMLCAARYAPYWPRDAEISVRPDFSGTRAEGCADVRIRVTPLALVPSALVFAWRAFGPGS